MTLQSILSSRTSTSRTQRALEEPWAPAPAARGRSRSTLEQLESTNPLVFRGILSFGEDYSLSASLEEIISKTRGILWCPFWRGKCVINLRGFLSFRKYFFLRVFSCSGYVPTRISNFMIWFLQDYPRDYMVFGSRIFIGENVSKLQHIDLTREPPEAEHRFFNENYLGY